MSQLHAVVNMLGPLLAYTLKNKMKTFFGSFKMLIFFYPINLPIEKFSA